MPEPWPVGCRASLRVSGAVASQVREAPLGFPRRAGTSWPESSASVGIRACAPQAIPVQVDSVVASSGQPVQSVEMFVDEGLFLGVRPTLDLGFAATGSCERRVRLRIDDLAGSAVSGVPSSGSRIVTLKPTVHVGGRTHVESAVRALKNVDPQLALARRRWLALRPFDSSASVNSLRVGPSIVEGRLACGHTLARGHSPGARAA